MKKVVTTLSIIIMGVMLVVPCIWAINFNDLPENHWAKNYIQELAEQGVINGYSDGTFQPEGTITRGEFLKLVMAASIPSYWDLEEVGKNFEHWAAQYVLLAEMQGVLESGEITKENIDQPITRLEMMRMVAKADTIMKASSYNLNKTYTFSDVNNLTPDEAFLLQHAYSKGFINGYEDGTFRPEANMTRAEAATMIYRYTR